MNASSDFFWVNADAERGSLSIDKLESSLQPPALMSSSDDSELSSLDEDSMTSSRCGCCDSPVLKKPQDPLPQKLRVAFEPLVQVRLYALTIGDHPCCSDGLPITLDWNFNPEFFYWDIETSRERSQRFQMPRRMDYDEKRARLFEVSKYSTEEVRHAEINMVIKMLEHSWSQSSNLLPALEIEAIEDDDIFKEHQEEKKKAAEDSPVIYWKRNRGMIKRSNSFCE